MLGWIWQGIRTGVVTTRYPRRLEAQPEGVANRLVVAPALCRPHDQDECAAACPTGAIQVSDSRFRLDLGLCIQCRLCVSACPRGALSFTPEYELSVTRRSDLVTEVEQR